MEKFRINSEKLTIETIARLQKNKSQLELSESSKERINNCRAFLDNLIKSNRDSIYGINTGFGSLYSKNISADDLETLQKNLVVSHACGTGQEVPHEIVKMMMMLKVVGLSFGNSGVQLEIIERLIDFYNNDITPVVYNQGSLGASGDLSPLAHLSLPLIGLGEVYSEGKKISASEILRKFNWEPLHLKAKDGLALLNGTQFMSAYGISVLISAQQLSHWADLIGALSLDAYDGRIEPFNEHIHQIRPHKGQISTADNFRKILDGSEIIKGKKQHVQDPYSFRCIPQVHGASRDTIEYVASIFTTEINSVTDNPTIFPEENLIISAGNFHGQPLALGLDFLSVALAEIGSISERRTYQLLSGQRGLPPFLVSNPGLNSGLMIPQYTAASIVSQNKQLCTPASVDSIVSSNGQEDHVSMGANAATKALQIATNLERILAIELLTAAQALEFRRPLKTSPILEKVLEDYRRKVPFISHDRVLHKDIENSVTFIKENFYPVL